MWVDLYVGIVTEFVEAAAMRFVGTSRYLSHEDWSTMHVFDHEAAASKSREDARKYRAKLAKDPEELARFRAKRRAYQKARYDRLHASGT